MTTTTNKRNDEMWLSYAIEKAKKAQEINEVPVGAILVDSKQQKIASAYNKPITTNNPTAHAEIEVLKNAGQIIKNYRLIKTTLYVTLEPCPMCTGAIIHARVSRVVFAARDFKSGACGSVFNLHKDKNLNHSFQADFIENKEYIKLLQSFFRERR